VAAGLLTLAMGCIHGPTALRVSHEAHNEAIQTRMKEELLLNLIRLRYREVPLFLQMGSVVVQFQFDAAAGLSATLKEGGPDEAGLSAGVGMSERPTFTYTPMQDNEFVQRMLRPVDIRVPMLLQRSGWSIDRVMRLTIQRVNGIDNATRASGPTPDTVPSYDEFQRLSAALRRLQIEEAVTFGYESVERELSAPVPVEAVSGSDMVAAAREGYRFVARDDGRSLVLTGPEQSLVMRIAPDRLRDPAVRSFVDLLGLEPGLDRYTIVSSSSELPSLLDPAGTRREIAVATRSLLGTLYYLSQAIEVPAADVERGLVTRTRGPEDAPFDWGRVSGDLLRIRSSDRRPERAAVKVPYRGSWFYIEDDDLQSKSTFALLLGLFALQSGASAPPAPVLTLPAGR